MPKNSQGTLNGEYSPVAVISIVISLLGIPLFGLVTGPTAIILAAIALGHIHQSGVGLRGRSMAYSAIVIGMLDIVIWGSLFGVIMTKSDVTSRNRLEQATSTVPVGLGNTPAHIQHAMEANVFLIVEKQGLFGFLNENFTGSGIVLLNEGDNALILTNRHVADPSFASGSNKKPAKVKITACFYNGASGPARVLWMAPQGIDLAVLLVGNEEDVSNFCEKVEDKTDMQIGDRVFTVGNPHDFAWSYTEGVISGFRRMKGPQRINLVQTQTPINVGNSGGGLYDSVGRLIGIVTWTKDKMEAEGISFAITYRDFLDLYKTKPQPDEKAPVADIASHKSEEN